MAYQIGNIVAGADYNALIGSQGTSVYASQSAVNSAAPAIGAIYGAGYGDRGYGQTGVTLSAVSPGAVITAAEWLNLRNALATVRESQTGAVPSAVPPANLFDPGDLVEAIESSALTSDAYDFNSEITSADTDRFTASSLSVTSLGTVTRIGTWGSGSGFIQMTYDVTWSNNAQARYFFNSGGEIRIALSHPGGPVDQDDFWSTKLDALGSIIVKARSISTSGGMFATYAGGYFDAADTETTAYHRAIGGTDAYGPSSLISLYFARVGAASSTDGSNGNGLRFRIRLTDGHTSSFYDLVAAGTQASFSFAKNIFLNNPSIESPTGSLVAGWSTV